VAQGNYRRQHQARVICDLRCDASPGPDQLATVQSFGCFSMEDKIIDSGTRLPRCMSPGRPKAAELGDAIGRQLSRVYRTCCQRSRHSPSPGADLGLLARWCARVLPRNTRFPLQSIMNKESELAVVRRSYAKLIMAAVCVADARVEEAFATVRREDYLGLGPWPILRRAGYVNTPDADPVYLYDDVLIGITPERGLNNGMPSYHAPLISGAGIKNGEHVVHIGAGVGYYSAILRHLAGDTGELTAIEFDPELAIRTRQNLATLANVVVKEGDGCTVPFDAADVIYVNAGATRPADQWLDKLKEDGRLILPLTARKTLAGSGTAPLSRHGAVFQIERKGSEFHARWISAVGVYPCEGGRDQASEAALDAALTAGGWERVTRLYRTHELPDDQCWLRAPGWALAYG
jgi:protein-L-isoaspartate(D-aspartate) O-methyltransferase